MMSPMEVLVVEMEGWKGKRAMRDTKGGRIKSKLCKVDQNLIVRTWWRAAFYWPRLR